MKKYDFSLTLLGLSKTEAFADASAEEMRVLLALVEYGGKIDADILPAVSRVSRARCDAAVALWKSSGVLAERLPEGKGDTPCEENRVEYEFSARPAFGELLEQTNAEVAETVRAAGLRALFDDLAAMRGKPMLSNEEIRTVTGLYEQYRVSAEYIMTLAASLSDAGKLTIATLRDKAIRLVDKGVDTVEELNAYLAAPEKDDKKILEVRKLLGIYGRKLSPSETKYIRKWTGEYGFSIEIIGEAYDITVLNTQSASITYMDTILSDWYLSGCKTPEECRARSEATKPQAPEKPKRKEQADKPRYGDFDPEDALNKALARSFGGESGTDSERK